MFKKQIGIIPTLNSSIPQTIRRGLRTSKIRKIKSRHGQGVFDMGDN